MRYTVLVRVLWAVALLAGTPSHASSAVDSASIGGSVTLRAADGEEWAGAGVRLTLVCGSEGISRTAVSDDRGEFRFVDLPADACSITTDLQGFAAVSADANLSAGTTTTLQLRLDVVPLFSGLIVTGDGPLARRPVSTPPESGPARSTRSARRTYAR